MNEYLSDTPIAGASAKTAGHDVRRDSSVYVFMLLNVLTVIGDSAVPYPIFDCGVDRVIGHLFVDEPNL
jgi:hypothetical protein